MEFWPWTPLLFASGNGGFNARGAGVALFIQVRPEKDRPTPTPATCAVCRISPA